MAITKEALQEILGDPQRTRNVVVAAYLALDALDSADIAGKTVDGDDAAMVARNQLSQAFVDWDAVALLAKNNEDQWCTCGAKTPQGQYHAPGCPARERSQA